MTFPAVDSLATYGGELVDLLPITDPTTDRSAASANAAYASVAGMTHTALRCWCRFTAAATTGALVLQTHDAAWGSSLAVAPTLARTGTGTFTVTWPATFTNELGDTQSVALRAVVVATMEGAIAFQVQAERTAANVVTVHVFSGSGTADDAPGFTLIVGAV